MPSIDSMAGSQRGRSPLPPEQLQQEVAALGPRWSIADGELRCELRGATMAKCGEAAAYAASLADEMDHHPRIVLEYGGTTVSIHTHDQHAITAVDIVYAARFERWLRSNGWA